MNWIVLVSSLIGAYLLGSLPFAVWISRAFGLADPRTQGSGNPGATNMLRIGGKLPAILTLLGDGLKGAVAVLLAKYLGLPPLFLGWIALAAMIGHLWPIWSSFKGGKGVATFLGCALALAWPVGLALLVFWLVVAYCFRYSSLAALASGAIFPLLLWLCVGVIWLWPSIIMSLLLIARHRLNIMRLWQGKETKIGVK